VGLGVSDAVVDGRDVKFNSLLIAFHLGIEDHMTNKGDAWRLERYVRLLTLMTLPTRLWFYCSDPSYVLGRCSEPIGFRINLMLNSRRIDGYVFWARLPHIYSVRQPENCLSTC